MSIIAWIVLGLLAGVVAKRLVPGMDREGIVTTTLLGVAGALAGGFLATNLFHVTGIQGFFNLSTWVTAIAGSALLLFAYHLLTGGNSRRRTSRWAGHR
jgi:uncharacterized membrane protein YeaQ/YmgE (transglycosylase-associated protein family)